MEGWEPGGKRETHFPVTHDCITITLNGVFLSVTLQVGWGEQSPGRWVHEQGSLRARRETETTADRASSLLPAVRASGTRDRHLGCPDGIPPHPTNQCWLAFWLWFWGCGCHHSWSTPCRHLEFSSSAHLMLIQGSAWNKSPPLHPSG